MSQTFTIAAITESSDANRQALTNDAGDDTSCHPAFSSLAMLPGLNSFIQSLSSHSPTSSSTPSHQFSAQSPPQPTPSSSNSDIEKLERLKKEILEGQNPIYKAVPQPSFLESLYLGRSVQPQNSAPAHADQVAKALSPSTTPQAASPISPTDGVEIDDSERITVDRGQEKLGAQSVLDVSSNVEEKANGEAVPGFTEGAHPTGSSPPQAELKSPPHEQQRSSVSEQNSLHASSIGAADAASLAHLIPGQPVAVPSAQNLNILPAAAGTIASHSPHSKSGLANDPPYDPKESLRFLEGSSIWSSERYRHGSIPYGSKESVTQYASDDARGTGQQKGGDWTNRYDHRFNEHPGNHWDKHVNTASNADFSFERSMSRSSIDAFQAADEFSFRESQSNGTPTHLVIGRTLPSTSANDTISNQIGHSAVVTPSLASSATGGMHTRAYSHPTDDKSRLHARGGLHSTAVSLQSSLNGDSSAQTIEVGPNSSHGKPNGNVAPSASRDGTGVRIPLEERISSPVNSSPQVAQGSYLGSGQDTRHTNGGSRTSLGREPSRLEDIKSIPTPLSLVRPRRSDGKAVPASPSSASGIGHSLHQYSRDQTTHAVLGDFVKPYDIQTRYPVHGDNPQTPMRESSQDTHGSLTTPPEVMPDAKMTGSYRDNGHRVDGGRPFADVAFYERPVFQERDAPTFEGRTGPPNRGRGWRGRGTYPRPNPARSDVHPPSGNPPRFWTGNARGRHLGAPFVDNRDKYLNRESERRPPPRSWDREESDYARPPPEVYPPPDDLDHERYPPTEFHERPRIRGRSPSPMRRATYGGPVTDSRPSKRVREEPYYDDRDRRYTGYQTHQAPSSPDVYYDTQDPYAPRDINEGYYDRDAPYYDRRVSDMAPPPSPPYPGRAVYSRPDVGRYNGAPPRTA